MRKPKDLDGYLPVISGNELRDRPSLPATRVRLGGAAVAEVRRKSAEASRAARKAAGKVASAKAQRGRTVASSKPRARRRGPAK